ncbi:MAG: hypothetical protein HYY46_11935 [Deltaproteobacteria bacterium]|nr:hypothetical protein [Deltaproteobacteria bacterium]
MEIFEGGAVDGDRLIAATRFFVDSRENRERLGAHLQQRLEKIGVRFSPPDLPSCPSIEVVAPAEWPEVDGESYGVVWVECARLPDGIECTRLPESLYEIKFINFKIRCGRVWYPHLFANALHEAAHLAEWHARIEANGNRFTWAEWQQIEKLGHGRCFAEIEHLLQQRSVDLGFFIPERPNAVPDEVADMFDDGA